MLCLVPSEGLVFGPLDLTGACSLEDQMPFDVSGQGHKLCQPLVLLFQLAACNRSAGCRCSLHRISTISDSGPGACTQAKACRLQNAAQRAFFHLFPTVDRPPQGIG